MFSRLTKKLWDFAGYTDQPVLTITEPSAQALEKISPKAPVKEVEETEIVLTLGVASFRPGNLVESTPSPKSEKRILSSSALALSLSPKAITPKAVALEEISPKAITPKATTPKSPVTATLEVPKTPTYTIGEFCSQKDPVPKRTFSEVVQGKSDESPAHSRRCTR